jgi:predicted transcriptional regulator
LIHQKCDIVINEIHNALCQSSDDTQIKETMAFAIRVCLIQAGDKFSNSIKSTIMKTLINNLNAEEESCRTNLAACLGSLCKSLSTNDFENVVKNHLFEISGNNDGLNHSKSVALRICLKETPERLLKTADWNDKTVKTLISHITSDKAFISINGIKATAYYILYNLNKNLEIPAQLVTIFSKCLNNSNNEIKICVAYSSSFIAKNYEAKPSLPISLLRTLIPLLVNGTKEKNSVVKLNSEQALVHILKLKKGDEVVNDLMSQLDEGPKQSLEQCLSKTLRRVTQQSDRDETGDFDETLLT